MPYYPKSQTQLNLYTIGGEFSLTPPNSTSQQTSYVGFYYKVSSGQAYTGKTPTNGSSRTLYPITNIANEPSSTNQITVQYDTASPDSNILIDQYNASLGSNVPKRRLLPQPSHPQPTLKDEELGVFTRYFCKKNNELKYMEIDKLTFDKLSSRSQDIAWDLYTPHSMLWYLRSFEINENLVHLIEREQKWYGFSQYFKGDFYYWKSTEEH